MPLETEGGAILAESLQAAIAEAQRTGKPIVFPEGTVSMERSETKGGKGKMRRINLQDYTVKVKVEDQANPGQQFDAEFPYRFKDSLLSLMFIRELQLGGAELVKQNVLAMKLETCKDDEILLEDEEWQRIKRAVDTFRGFTRNDVELVRRIEEAEEVEVEPKK